MKAASPYLCLFMWLGRPLEAFLATTTSRISPRTVVPPFFVSRNDMDKTEEQVSSPLEDGFLFNNDTLSALPLSSTESLPSSLTPETIAEVIQYLQNDLHPFERDDYWKKVRKHVTQATTMPPEAFRSADFYQVEQEKLFAATWQVAAFTEQLRNKGDVVTATVAGQPILLTMGKDGNVRGFFNVCRHRGARLVKDPVQCGKKSISCPYHNWGYSLDGRLMGTPLWGKDHRVPDDILAARLVAAGTSQDIQGFDKAENGLLPVRVDTWGPFVYVNVDGKAPPLQEYLGRVTSDLELYPFDDFVTVKQDHINAKANWKLLAENFMDFYHVPVRRLSSCGNILPAFSPVCSHSTSLSLSLPLYF